MNKVHYFMTKNNTTIRIERTNPEELSIEVTPNPKNDPIIFDPEDYEAFQSIIKAAIAGR